MHTISGVRTWALEELTRARVNSPALTADLLLGYVLDCDRVRILSHGEERISEEAWSRVCSLVFRRSNGEPLQYLTGEQEFYGLVFKVTPDVLIPRPETEILVEKTLELIRLQAPRPIYFADIGTGSGCIAVAIAHEIPCSLGWAVDLSSGALRVAKENAHRHQVEERILLVQSSLFDCFPEKQFLDFVFCNPPYVAADECDSLPCEVKNHEPHDALFGGASGLDIYHRLLPEVWPRLNPGGWVLLELGAGQAQQVGRIVESTGLCLQTILKDLQGIPRCLVARKTTQEN